MELVETWLQADVDLKATVIHERLVTEHGFTGNYQRVKMFLRPFRDFARNRWPLRGSSGHRRLSVLRSADG